MTKYRPRVAIFYDVPDWAFHNIAINVEKIGCADYQFDLVGHEDWFGQPQRAAEIVETVDMVVFLWRFDIISFLDSVNDQTWDKITTDSKPIFITMIYDHLYMDADDLSQIGDPFGLSDVVGACSERLRAAYAAQSHLPDPSFVVPDGVDLAKFTPNHRALRANRPLRIGWVGNSAMGRTVAPDLKGKTTIFDPAIERLKRKGLVFETRIADRATQPVTRDDMPAFYGGIDVLVCSSSCEGTPNPLLEAVASGVAVVTTDVGLTREVLGPIQSEFILQERSVGSLADALERLIENPDMVLRMQQENVARRDALSWDTRWPIWQEMFETALQTAADDTAHRGAQHRAFSGFRNRNRSLIERIRRKVAQNPAMYRSYAKVRDRWPGAIRIAKQVVQRGRL